ncbi:MAG: type I phosphomannose isomerase catalytic subunit [Chloroflexota bacterium]|jgi:mannose-6-phosphate isomerase
MSVPIIRLRRRLEQRLWGGTTLAHWLNLTDAPHQLAETWEIYNDNAIVNGPLHGQTLRQAVAHYGPRLVGQASFDRYGAEFPLLAKFIDAAQPLSVQVHPDDTYAHTHEAHTGFHGKTEAWYILNCDTNSDVIHDFVHAISRQHYADAIHDGTLDGLLRHVPVIPGDTVFVPAGTVHAINAGIMLFEIQQTSDLTYRVYDYNRRDAQGNLRDLHIAQALDVSYLGQPRSALTTPIDRGNGVRELVRSEFFVMEHIHHTQACTWARPGDSFQILTLIDGAMTITSDNESHQLTRGDSLIIPADMQAYQSTPDNHAIWLRCWVPG